MYFVTSSQHEVTRLSERSLSEGGWHSRGFTAPLMLHGIPISEVNYLVFPAGKHDDQVDALGLVGQLLDKMTSGQKPIDPEKPRNISGYKSSAEIEKDSYKIW